MPAGSLAGIGPNTIDFETMALVKPAGFREYDARWWFGRPGSDREPEINLLGFQALGMGLGTLPRRMGRPSEIVTVNGVRVVAADGTWGLVRASSNKPEIVVVVESPVSAGRRREMFQAVDALLREEPGIGPYNQTF